MKNKLFGDQGFTFLELLIVMIIFGILLTIAYPKFEREKARWELNAVARQMATDIRNWQQRAVVEQNSGLTLTIYENELIYRFKEDATIKETRDLSGILKTMTINLPSNVKTINFGISGTTNNYCTITLQNQFGEYKYVVINSVGRVRVSSTRP